MDTINFLYSLIGTPLGYLLYFIYEIGIKNVGLAIIIFTLVVKLAMLPLSIKQQKNTARSAIFAPKVREIQQKYKNNQQKQQEELAKLQQQGYSPMGGCGSMILTFLLLFGVLDVVYRPLTHIAHLNADSEIVPMIQESYDIKAAAIFVDEYNNIALLEGNALKDHNDVVRDAKKILDYYNSHLEAGDKAYDESVWNSVSADSIKIVNRALRGILKDEYETVKANNNGNGKEIALINTDMFAITEYKRTDADGNLISSEKDELKAIKDDAEKTAYREAHCFGDKTRQLFSTLQTQYGQLKAMSDGTVTLVASASLQRELYVLDTFGTVKTYADGSTVEYKQFFSVNDTDSIQELYNNLDILGIMLVHVPSEHLSFPMIMLIVVATLLSLVQAFISNRQMEKNNPGAVGGGMKVTMYIMPIFSLFFVINVPAGAGFYWTISYVFGIVQSILLNKLMSPEKLKAQAEAEYKAKMKIIEAQASRVRDTDRDNSIVEYNGEKLTQKEINRRKLAEARRQDAIKYGEEYIEDDDDI
ncbi:MAG: YidC/Oxa1 family membrane protein insertase [Oscillospiraceae bacterium]|nr:YidC/Oxa1 family membrane protein insertase [Oscillospiraceae bacterium]